MSFTDWIDLLNERISIMAESLLHPGSTLTITDVNAMAYEDTTRAFGPCPRITPKEGK